MTTAKAPGVYITERPSGVRTITGVSTSVPAFLGYTKRLTPSGEQTLPPFTDAERQAPQRMDSWREFTERYNITAVAAELVQKKAELATAEEGEARKKTRLGMRVAERCMILAEAVYGFFANGGSTCYVVGFIDPAKKVAPTGVDGLEGSADRPLKGLDGLQTVPEVSMVAVPGLWDMTTDASGEPNPPKPAVAQGKLLIGKVVKHCTDMRNRVGIFEPPPDQKPSGVETFISDQPTQRADAAYTTYYYPWLHVPGVDGVGRTVPPCGHIAGVWARTDAERGVFKAPANQNLRGVLDVPVLLTDLAQGRLNDKGINCLRVFPGQGLLVWGARTRSKERDWVYLNVRRLVCFLAESIRLSSTWAVFEPNDDRLWASLRHSVTSFLTDQWRQGALLGRTPEEAFYVICDRTNNIASTIDAGKVICDIGVAPVRPAEFVHFQITQIAGEPARTG
ncbi:phage tail sheath subtilisin-like domain-containing protein [Streptomyces cinnamoneus]|uniref:phage tail sheath family protein n=1 Tax=Streptomyces cinnamoneus TaxID=53446 RepID=UPI0033C3E78D